MSAAQAEIVVVHNPNSSGADEARLRGVIRSVFGSRPVDFCETSEQHDLTERLAPWLQRGVGMVIAAGGDGTISEIADVLAGRETVLGILPQGTSNVMARELNLPLKPLAAARILAGDYGIRKLDVLRAGDSVCVLGISVGISASAMQETTRTQKRLFGPWAYWLPFFKRFFDTAGHFFTVELDGYATQLRASDVLAMNAGLIGFRAIRWGSEVQPDDGLVNFCFLQARNGFDYLWTVMNFALRRYIRNERVNVVPMAQSIRFAKPEGLPVQGDGDLIGVTPMTVTIQKAALNVAVPK
jgi:diacylglycerol kinase family enzyme